METFKLPNRKAAKLKFFATYSLSVLLIFIVLSSFLKAGPAGKQNMVVTGQTTANRLVAVDQLLHRQMEKIMNAGSIYVLKNASPESAAALKQETNNLNLLADSLRTAIADADTKEKQDIEALLDVFSREAEKQASLVKTFATVSRGSKSSEAGASSSEMNELKAILVQKEQKIQELETRSATALLEKDRTIADLEKKVNAQPAAGATDDAAQWKDKYEKLKAANDKTVSESNSLKTAYKEVVDDNRRLINQLQAARAGKN
jgi:hypothetical protein